MGESYCSRAQKKRDGEEQGSDQANEEAVPPRPEGFFYDTLTISDLAAVEASFDRTRLLTEQGADVAAMGLDAANAIQAGNSLEKMLAHQLAAAHKATIVLLVIKKSVPFAGLVVAVWTEFWRYLLTRLR